MPPLRHDDDPARGPAVIAVTSVCWMTVQFSRSGKRAPAGDSGRRSLKAQQHAGARWARRPVRSQAASSAGAPGATSSSVDVRNPLEGSGRRPDGDGPISRRALQSWSSLERR